ncbi:hypothetical protein [Nitrospirillum viridazoti]|uniref:Uncharacterized protein n=1 Tax=Nitrospirillum amazonense TaxID=28077 RepID=A0A560HUJ3_9PROT|nr:hypothetical protein [Nitrospirillum amazonense]TWB48660.1 hypothetical protein FBZ92_12939 [Nitrospirillum amazonense]
MTAFAASSRTASFRFFKVLPDTAVIEGVALLIAASINAML